MANPCSYATRRVSIRALWLFTALLLCSLTAHAQQAIILDGVDDAGLVTLPSSTPFNALGDLEIVFRLRDARTNHTATQRLFSNDRILIYLAANTNWLVATDWSTGGQSAIINISTRTYFKVRRVQSTGTVTLEGWNADGSNYAIDTLTGGSTGTLDFSGTLGFGRDYWALTSLLQAKVDWFRWKSSVGTTSVQPLDSDTSYDLLRWEFEGNGNDSSANGLNLTLSGSPAFENNDTTPPSVTITSPTAGQIVTGTIAVTASASDNVGVVGVQFRIDGNNIASEDTSPPYAVSLDTTSLAEGSHTLSAVARDAAGNTNTANAGVNVRNPRGLILDGVDDGAVVTLPASSPFNAIGDFEVVFRMRDVRVNHGSAQKIFSNDRVLVWIPSGDSLTATDWSANGSAASINISTRTYFKVRHVRATGITSVEGWNADGSNYAIDTLTGSSTGTLDFSGPLGLGRDGWTASAFLQAKLDWLKWKSSVGTTGVQPLDSDANYDLLRWEFEGNGNDSSARGLDLTLTGVAYGYSPVILAANAGEDKTSKAGATVSLDARTSVSSLGGETYSWQQVAGTSVTLTGAGTAQPSFVAPTPAGDNAQLTFRVTVTAAGSSVADDVDVGVVKTDADDIITLSDPVWSFLLGPQVMAGSANIPNVERFERKLNQEGLRWGGLFPAIPPISDPTKVAGTVTVTNSSTSVVGVGTTFTADIEMAPEASDYFRGNIWIFDGTNYVLKRVAAVVDDTHLTLASAWTGASGGGKDFHTGANGGDYINFDRYDLARVFYQQFYRTGLVKWRTLARKVADSHWRSENYWYGTVTGGVNFPPPYNGVEAGAIMRAYDGKPERWDYLYRVSKDLRYVPRVYNARTWTGPTLPGDARDMGWSYEWFAMVVKAMPSASYDLYPNGTHNPPVSTDTYTTTERNNDILLLEDSFTQVFERLQYSDGSWRYDIGNFDGCSCPLYSITQPYMEGILLHALVRVRELSSDTTVRADILTVMKKSLDFLNTTYGETTAVANCGSLTGCSATTYWRASVYFAHGGPAANPTEYDPPYTYGTSGTNNALHLTSGDGSVRGSRWQQQFWLYPAGYYYAATGDDAYKVRGDEYYDSMWGTGDGGGTYGVYWYATADSLADKQKDFGEAYMSAASYLAYRLTP